MPKDFMQVQDSLYLQDMAKHNGQRKVAFKPNIQPYSFRDQQVTNENKQLVSKIKSILTNKDVNNLDHSSSMRAKFTRQHSKGTRSLSKSGSNILIKNHSYNLAFQQFLNHPSDLSLRVSNNKFSPIKSQQSALNQVSDLKFYQGTAYSKNQVFKKLDKDPTKNIYIQNQKFANKLLGCKSHYSFEKMDNQHQEHMRRVQQISKFDRNKRSMPNYAYFNTGLSVMSSKQLLPSIYQPYENIHSTSGNSNRIQQPKLSTKSSMQSIPNINLDQYDFNNSQRIKKISPKRALLRNNEGILIQRQDSKPLSKTRNLYNTNGVDPNLIMASKFITSHDSNDRKQYGNLLSKKQSQREKNSSSVIMNSQRSNEGRRSTLSNEAQKFERIIEKFANSQNFCPIKLPTEVRVKHPNRFVIFQDKRLFQHRSGLFVELSLIKHKCMIALVNDQYEFQFLFLWLKQL